ncbi:MAG: hypothetical protein WCI55_17255 [Armatimonadota bacterium]
MSRFGSKIVGLCFALVAVGTGATLFAKWKPVPTQLALDKARMDSIQAGAPAGESEQISIPGLVFAAKPFCKGKFGPVSNQEVEERLTNNLEFMRLNKRVNQLSNQDGMSSSCGFPENEKVRTCIYANFSIEVVKVKQVNKSIRYYAVRPVQGIWGVTVKISEPDRVPDIPALKRSDFINPQDVDWMFGVKDFTKVTP